MTLGIAGAGLIGGSIALRAAELGWTVGAFDVDPEHGRYARERLGVAFLADSLAELAERSDVLVLAAPLEATLAQLAELARERPVRPRAIVDVASVKEPVARAGAAIDTFVATHPIAGSERSGPSAARADLFVDRVWSYDPQAAGAARAEAVAFIRAMGARPVAIASAEHDRAIALTSHLPQLVSVALASQIEPRAAASADVEALSGPGLRSMLRLAGSSWHVWQAILRANAIPLAQEVRRLANILSDIAEALETDAPASLAERFSQAAAISARLHANDPVSRVVVSSNTSDER